MTQRDTSRSRILVVDDEPDVVDMLREYLSHAGFSVDTALNGMEALRLIQHARPDAILLDINMPGMPGMEVLQHIRARDSTIPVIMVTSVTDLGLAQATLKAGAFDFVMKPIDFAYLDRVIDTALHTRDAPE